MLVGICFDAAGLVSDVHTVFDIDPNEPSNMPVLIAIEWTQPAPHRFCVKDLAFRNISFMFCTFEAGHFEMSPLNDVAPWNIPDMSLTLDTSQSIMEQTTGNALRQLSRALLSSVPERGANPSGGGGKESNGAEF